MRSEQREREVNDKEEGRKKMTKTVSIERDERKETS